MAATSHFRTPFNGYSVKFSPFFADRIAVSASQNFGIVGNGHQYVLRRELNALNNNNTNNNNNNFPHSGPATLPLVEEARFETADGIFDCAWSEESENVLVSAWRWVRKTLGRISPTVPKSFAFVQRARGGNLYDLLESDEERRIFNCQLGRYH